MPTIEMHMTAELLPVWKWQIVSFQRAVWPEGFMGDNLFRDWITKADDHPLSFIMVAGNLLIGHVNVVWKYLPHAATTFKMYGLTGVFTYPSFRGMGYGLQLIQAATRYIDQQDGDIGLFHCDPQIAGIYERVGWSACPQAQTLIGPPEARVMVDERMMFRVLSPKGNAYQHTFMHGTILFGDDSTW